MRISALDLDDLSEVDLRPVKMERLGTVVAIAGRNGAGKSRLLREIESRIGDWDQRTHDALRIGHLRTWIKTQPGSSNVDAWNRELILLEKRVAKAGVITLSEERKPRVVRLVPSNLNLSDPNSLTKESLLNSAKAIDKPGVENLPTGTFARIQSCQNRRWEATHAEKTISSAECDAAILEYERLKKLIKQFLDADLGCVW